MHAEILPTEKLGLRRVDNGRAVIPVAEGAGGFRLVWQWPAPRLADACLVGVSAQEPAAGADPRAMELSHLQRVERIVWDAQDECLVIPRQAAWIGHVAAVWAVVDVGFASFTSAALVLGRLPRRGGWRWDFWRSDRSGRGPLGPEATPA